MCVYIQYKHTWYRMKNTDGIDRAPHTIAISIKRKSTSKNFPTQCLIFSCLSTRESSIVFVVVVPIVEPLT